MFAHLLDSTSPLTKKFTDEGQAGDGRFGSHLTSAKNQVCQDGRLSFMGPIGQSTSESPSLFEKRICSQIAQLLSEMASSLPYNMLLVISLDHLMVRITPKG